MGALGWEGSQPDLWDIELELEASNATAQAAETQDAAADEIEDGGLFPLSAAGSRAIGETENPATRILAHPHTSLLLDGDLRTGLLLGEHAEVAINLRIDIAHAGHVFIVASTVEREIRRCERALREILRTDPRTRARDVGPALRARLARDPVPAAIKGHGLLLRALEGKDGSVRASMIGNPTIAPLALLRWTSFTTAFALAALADQHLTVSAHETEFPYELNSPRMKPIAGGIPRGAIELEVLVRAEQSTRVVATV